MFPRKQCLKACILLAVFLLLGIDSFVGHFAGTRISRDLSKLPNAHYVLLLGTGKFYHDAPNIFYANRIRSAVELYHADHSRVILVSGAGINEDRSETEDMKGDLLSAGVPASNIQTDPNGLRTIASIRYANTLVHALPLIVVSQRFHIERALFLARCFGMNAYGFPADDAPWPWQQYVRMREVLARAAAVVECQFAP